jgi:hypothetical protein
MEDDADVGHKRVKKMRFSRLRGGMLHGIEREIKWRVRW